ncbi:MAG: NRAMP family divalent metal transporter [Aeromicrobium sp.]
MKRYLGVALGIIASLGGFVDIGELVFNSQAGAIFGYKVLWAIPVGVIGITVFSELSGRVAIVTGQANMDLIRENYPRWLSLTTLVFGLAVCLITLSAELGGLGLVLHYALGWNEGFFTLVALLLLVAASALLHFQTIERVFGYAALGLLVYIVAALHHGVAWHAVGGGLVPSGGSSQYWYFVVALIAAGMMPYEIYFYSSGGIEERWTKKDLPVNILNSAIGYPLGGLVAMSIAVVAAQQLLYTNVVPTHLGTTMLEALRELGPVGLTAALVGAFFAIGGSTIDSAFSCAYNLAQHQRWRWGKKDGIRHNKKWAATLFAAFALGYAIVQTQVDPISLTEYAVIGSAVAMPLSFWPVVRASQDSRLMGQYASGILARPLSWLFFGVICIVAIAGPVLMVLTHMGELG